MSIVLLVPTAFWVRLRLPAPAAGRRVRHAAAVRHPADRPRLRPDLDVQPAAAPLTATNSGSDVLLVCAYVVLSFPYMYRAVDAGLRTIDIRTLTEASQSLGAGWFTILWRVILPNLRVAILSGAFLTLAIVVGEFTIANFLARPDVRPVPAADLGQPRLRARGRRPHQLRDHLGWRWA